MNSSASQAGMAIPGDAGEGDFADWLSPMIVKELRQGLRTRTFTGLFILIQVVMVITTFISLGSIDAQSVVGGFFWFLLSLTVGLIIPLKGLQAINRESGENTLDLLVLTRLRAFRIVSGKWIALVAQALLAAVAVLPYIFLRYFLGGVNVLHELLYLGFLLFGSAVLSAITVCLSASGGRKVRKGFGIFGFLLIGFLAFQGFGMLMMMTMGGRAPASIIPDVKTLLLALPVVLGFGSYLIYFFLEIGAGRLAPGACNHTTRRRLVSLGMAVPLGLLVILGATPASLWTWLATVTAFLVIIDALTDLPSVMRSLLVPFHARRASPASYFLAPGWHTGTLYSLAFLALWGIAVFASGSSSTASTDDRICMFLMVAAIVVVPAAAVAVLLQHRRKPFRDYLVVHLVSVCVTAVASLMSGVSDKAVYLVLGCLLTPHAVPPLVDELDSNQSLWGSIVAGTHLAIAYLLLAWRGGPLLAGMRRLNREIRADQRAAATAENPPGSGE